MNGQMLTAYLQVITGLYVRIGRFDGEQHVASSPSCCWWLMCRGQQMEGDWDRLCRNGDLIWTAVYMQCKTRRSWRKCPPLLLSSSELHLHHVSFLSGRQCR